MSDNEEIKIGDMVKIIGTSSTADGCLGKVISKSSELYTIEIFKSGRQFKEYNMNYLGWKLEDKHTISVFKGQIQVI